MPPGTAWPSSHALANISKRSAPSEFHQQWRNPSDIFSLLLIIGPDIIKAALAQQAGYLVTPAVFSFGWMAYAFNTLLSVFGDGRMTPSPDFPAQLISAKFSHVRENKSWVIGRLLRDLELSRAEAGLFETDNNEQNEPFKIEIFSIDQNATQGEIKRDLVWYSGFFVILIQIVVAIVPIITKRNWAPIIITAGGTLLALLQGAIPQWKKEKWAWARKGGDTVSITQGNGSRYVMVILGEEHPLTQSSGPGRYKAPNLEMLAAGSQRLKVSLISRASSVMLAVLWVILLISVTGLEEDTWYLMAVGLLGMIHSIYVAGAARDSSALGIHLVKEKIIETNKVAEALQRLEAKFPLVGSSLIPTFFPGGMWIPTEQEGFWDCAAQRRGLQGYKQLDIIVKELPKRESTSG